MLEGRDFTLIIDKSGSTATPENGKSRWQTMQETAIAMAEKCSQYDPDGIDVYFFSSKFTVETSVTVDKVVQLFKQYEPAGGTKLAPPLKAAFDSYFKRKANNESSGATIVVFTDGEAEDKKEVMQTIVEASRQIDKDDELSLTLIQIGSDREATKFLKLLDDDLKGVGKFDITDTVTLEDIENEGITLTQVLLNSISD